MNAMGRDKVDMMISAGVDIACCGDLCLLVSYSPSIPWFVYKSVSMTKNI